MRIQKILQAGTIALCIASTSYATTGYRTTHRVHRSTPCVRTVDVNASPLPPLPTFQHVCVTNSATVRHRGVRGLIERAHRDHMRVRAFLYRNFLSG